MATVRVKAHSKGGKRVKAHTRNTKGGGRGKRMTLRDPSKNVPKRTLGNRLRGERFTGDITISRRRKGIGDALGAGAAGVVGAAMLGPVAGIGLGAAGVIAARRRIKKRGGLQGRVTRRIPTNRDLRRARKGGRQRRGP